MKKKTENLIPILLSFAVGLAWLAFVVCMSPVEESNDDAIIAYELLARKDHLVLFLNPLLCKILGVFYDLMPTVNWLTVSSFAGMATAVWSFTLVLLHRRNSFRNWTAVACLALMAWLGSAHLINFTRTTTLIALGGGILYWDTFFKKDSALPRLGAVLSIFLLMWAAMLRFESFVLMVPYLLLLWAASFAIEPEKLALLKGWKTHIRELLRYAALFLLPLLLGFCLQIGGTRYLEAQPGWKEYIRLNDVRSEVMDFSVSEWGDVAAGMEGTGFTEKDFDLFKQNVTEKPDTLTLENIERLGTLLKTGTAKSWWSHVRVQNYLLWLTIGTFVVLSLLNLKSYLCGVLLFAALAKLFVTCFIYMNRMLPRIYDPILMGALVCAVFFCTSQTEKGDRTAIGKFIDSLKIGELSAGQYLLEAISLFLMVMLVGEFVITKNVKPSAPFRMANNSQTRAIDTMIASDRLYIQPCGFHLKSYGLWRQPAALKDADNIILVGDWNGGTPEAVQNRMEKGVENPFWALLYDPNVYSYYSTKAQRYLSDYTGMGITVSQVDDTGGLSTVQYSYPIVPADAEQDAIETETAIRCTLRETTLRLENDDKQALQVTIEGLDADQMAAYSDLRINFYTDENWTLTCRLGKTENGLEAAVINFSFEFWAEDEAPKGYLIGRDQNGEYVRICGLELYRA